jgi:uncharacterized lipoprotein YehR (DUF1307 family)
MLLPDFVFSTKKIPNFIKKYKITFTDIYAIKNQVILLKTIKLHELNTISGISGYPVGSKKYGPKVCT